ncbi:MAG: radical SAM protein [Eubacteriales bacterium]|nr:radical SAM protein [Eubacteriales bacterium]MDD3882143.1 radical SAM protein [Eubacteriales bacterium]MDD4513248.1 radical SAM protein [Eubacteriales bacterium]
MKISKKDALAWFSFFSSLSEEEEILPHQQEIIFSVLSQIEEAVENEHSRLMSEIKGLKSLDGRTYYVGSDDKFPKGCRSCLTGTGLCAIRKTNRCNLNCKFCYDFGEMEVQPPIGEGMWEIGGTKFRAEDLPLLFSAQKKPTGVSYVYLEPFMEIEKYYPVIRAFRDAGVYQHLYTNGTLANEENLRALGESGLDELRFNLGASGTSDLVIKNIAIAKKYIPMVGIETPMTPEFYSAFQKKKDAILATKLDFINCAELHLNPNNIANYEGENLYMYRHGYVSPVYSRNLTLKLMKQADDEGFDIAVHDCSDRTKFARDLNLRAKEGGWFGSSSYASEFERVPFAAFLPILRDESFAFLEEEEMPKGFGFGDIVL